MCDFCTDKRKECHVLWFTPTSPGYYSNHWCCLEQDHSGTCKCTDGHEKPEVEFVWETKLVPFEGAPR